MVKNTMLEEDLDLDMNKHINVKYANEYACAKLIGEKIRGKYGFQIEPNEYTYLTIHIARLLR
jgi:transcriptional antiterminator